MKLRFNIYLPVLVLAGLCVALPGHAQAKKQTGQKKGAATQPAKPENVVRDTVFFDIPDSANYKASRPKWDELPEFPGGTDSLNQYILRNTVYPPAAIADNVEGRVFIRFAVETDGSLSEINVFIGLRSDIDAECVRVVREMPRWKPGTTVMRAPKGWYRTPTKWMYSIPFTFSLTKTENEKGLLIHPR